jgi:O-acetyl-ADP-ribose deacetylase (regulator of RNase III)
MRSSSGRTGKLWTAIECFATISLASATGRGAVIMVEKFKVDRAEIVLVQGDITSVDADAIVNAANSTLMGGGGVDGAIHTRGGPRILEECKHIRATRWPNGLPTGKAVVTSGGNLRARHGIHTVGPIWRGGTSGEPELLKQAYQNSLKLAVAEGLKTVAFPSISTGAYGYPIEKAGEVAIVAVKEFLNNEDGLDRIVFVLFTKHDLSVYREKAKKALSQA